MKAATNRRLMKRTKPPMNFYILDEEAVYVDHPESVLISDAVIAVDPGADGSDGVARELAFLSPDHVVRIEHTKRKPLRRVAWT